MRRGACGEGLDLYGRNRDYFTTVDQEYVAAVAEAADVALASGQPLRMLALLRQQVAVREPLNESLQARLMLMLAAAGQQALALAHYQAVRERLWPVPWPGQVLPKRQADKPARVIHRPVPLLPLVSPAQLLADLPTFACRESELSQLSGILSPGGGRPTVAICAIDGQPGIGKTTFAIHWAHQIAKHFADGQLYVNLRGFDSSGSAAAPVDALHTLLYSLGVPASYIPDGLPGHDLPLAASTMKARISASYPSRPSSHQLLPPSPPPRTCATA
jgi:hypothetical protein